MKLAITLHIYTCGKNEYMKNINTEKKTEPRICSKNKKRESAKGRSRLFINLFFWLVDKDMSPSGLSFLEVIPSLHAKEMQELAKSSQICYFCRLI